MKILQINAFHYLKGGVERYYFDLSKLLEQHGHEVIHFAMKHPKNFASPFEKYFASYFEVEKPKISQIFQIPRSIWSTEAQKKIEQLIKDEKPDIAHLHCPSRYLTPSIIPVLKKCNVPMIMTLHDFKVLCPNRNFYSHGHVCEKCKGGKFYSPILKRCIKNNLFVSLVGSVEAYIHYFLKVYQQVDHFIAPSKFVKNKFIEFGWPEKKITYLPHFIFLDQFRPQYTWNKKKNYCLYFGRLSPEKGLLNLIKAITKTPRINLYIAGVGPQKKELKSYATQNKISNVFFLSHKSKGELWKLIKDSMFTILPSEWYENAPFAIYESFILGKPVLGAKIGGIPELVKENETGLLFEIGNTQELSNQIKRMLKNGGAAVVMGKNARTFIENLADPEKHYKELIAIYEQIS